MHGDTMRVHSFSTTAMPLCENPCSVVGSTAFASLLLNQAPRAGPSARNLSRPMQGPAHVCATVPPAAMRMPSSCCLRPHISTPLPCRLCCPDALPAVLSGCPVGCAIRMPCRLCCQAALPAVPSGCPAGCAVQMTSRLCCPDDQSAVLSRCPASCAVRMPCRLCCPNALSAMLSRSPVPVQMPLIQTQAGARHKTAGP